MVSGLHLVLVMYLVLGEFSNLLLRFLPFRWLVVLALIGVHVWDVVQLDFVISVLGGPVLW